MSEEDFNTFLAQELDIDVEKVSKAVNKVEKRIRDKQEETNNAKRMRTHKALLSDTKYCYVTVSTPMGYDKGGGMGCEETPNEAYMRFYLERPKRNYPEPYKIPYKVIDDVTYIIKDGDMVPIDTYVHPEAGNRKIFRYNAFKIK